MNATGIVFQRHLKRLLKKLGGNQSAAARALGVSPSYINRTMNGEGSTEPKQHTCQKLCTELGVSYEAFIRETLAEPIAHRRPARPNPELKQFERWLTTEASASDQQFILNLARRMGYKPEK